MLLPSLLLLGSGAVLRLLQVARLFLFFLESNEKKLIEIK